MTKEEASTAVCHLLLLNEGSPWRIGKDITTGPLAHYVCWGAWQEGKMVIWFEGQTWTR